MPLVKVEMIKGHGPEYKKAVFECIHEGLVEAIQIEDWDRFQRIVEIEPDDFEYPSFKTENFMIIELTIFPGRTAEQKASAIQKITEKLQQKLAINPTDIFIVIHETSFENWGMGGQQLKQKG